MKNIGIVCCCFFLCACGTRKVESSIQETVQVQQAGALHAEQLAGVRMHNSFLQQQDTESYVRHTQLSVPDSTGYQYAQTVTEIQTRQKSDTQQMQRADSVSGFTFGEHEVRVVEAGRDFVVNEKSDTRAFSLSFRIVAGILIFGCVCYFCVKPLLFKKNLHNE